MYCCTFEAAAAHTQGRKQNATLNGKAIYLYGASLLQELRSVASTTCETHPSGFEFFLLTEVSQLTTSSLPVKIPYLRLSLFFHNTAEMKEALAARVKACAQRVVRAFKTHFSLRKRVVSPARAAEKRPPPSARKDSRRLGKCASTRASPLDLQSFLTAPPHKKETPQIPHDGYKAMSSILGSRKCKKGRVG